MPRTCFSPLGVSLVWGQTDAPRKPDSCPWGRPWTYVWPQFQKGNMESRSFSLVRILIGFLNGADMLIWSDTSDRGRARSSGPPNPQLTPALQPQTLLSAFSLRRCLWSSIQLWQASFPLCTLSVSPKNVSLPSCRLRATCQAALGVDGHFLLGRLRPLFCDWPSQLVSSLPSSWYGDVVLSQVSLKLHWTRNSHSFVWTGPFFSLYSWALAQPPHWRQCVW